jgi:hypothetical protein
VLEEVKVVPNTVPELVVIEVICESVDPDGVSAVLAETSTVEAERDVEMPLPETDIGVENVPIGPSLTETPVVDAG